MSAIGLLDRKKRFGVPNAGIAPLNMIHRAFVFDRVTLISIDQGFLRVEFHLRLAERRHQSQNVER